MLLYALIMLPSLFAFILTAVLYFLRSFGIVLRVQRIRLSSLHNISCSTRKRTLSIKKIGLTLHRPRSDNPCWAIIVLDEVQYKDNECQFSLERGEVKLWIFPVLFRFTAGPWIATTLDGFTVHVYNSKSSPWWVDAIRRNLLIAIINGETIRLNHSNTKAYLGLLTNPTANSASENEEKSGKEDEREETRDDLRLRTSFSQWHILFKSTARIYAFDSLEAELRRSWTEDRGSFVMVARDCRWIKVPIIGTEEGYRRTSVLYQLLHGFISLPWILFELCYDPVSVIDLYAPRTDITFGNFRIRDAELLHKGASKLKEEYVKLETQYPGVIEDFAWDMFVNGIMSIFKFENGSDIKGEIQDS